MPFRLAATSTTFTTPYQENTAGTFPCRDSAEQARAMLHLMVGNVTTNITEIPEPLNGVEIPEHTLVFMRRIYNTAMYRSTYNEAVEARGSWNPHYQPPRVTVPIIKELRDLTKSTLAEAKHWADRNVFVGRTD